MLKGNSKRENFCKEIQYKEEIFNNSHKMANIFNKYFVDSLTIFRDDSEVDVRSNIEYTESEFEVFSTIDVEQVRRIVQKLENKSDTEERITVEIMKMVENVAGNKICHVFNKSLEEGIFPNNWKQATVIPIPKVQGTKRIEEFRPINKLPIYEKILVSIVYKQLVQYIDDKKLLEECQSGFRASHSCGTALQWVVSSWKKSIRERKMIGIVFLDLRRAFELVDRNILIKKIKWYGIKGTVFKV